MSKSERVSEPNLWIPRLLGGLLVLGLAWWLWPRDATEPELAPSESADEPGLERAEPKPRPELAQRAKASLAGQVREQGGAALANAQVCALPDPDALQGLDGEPRCVRTDAEGRYAIAGLWPVRTRVSASAVGHLPAAWSARDARGRERLHVALAPDRETTGIDLELAGGGVRVAGVVEDLGGGVIEGARVWLDSSSFDAVAIAWSDAEGRFELWVPPGPVVLWAEAEGYARGRGHKLAPSDRCELRLIPESVLVGRVVDARTGEPIAGLAVGMSHEVAQAQTDGEGEFRLRGLEPGDYKPVAVGDEWYGEAAVKVQLGLGQTSAPVEIRVHPMALVEGRIVVAGRDDEGCGDGQVRLRSADGSDLKMIATDDEGWLRVRGLPPGQYDVEVRCEGFIADEYPDLAVVESIRGLIWEVREGQTIRGEIVGAERRFEGLHVSAQRVVEGEDARTQAGVASATVEPDGSFVITGLLPGRHELRAAGQLPTHKTPVSVELASGVDVEGVRIELPATGTLIGRVVDSRGEARADVEITVGPPGQRAESYTITDDAGNFRIESVRAGSLSVSAIEGGRSLRAPGASDDDPSGVQVEVGEGETVEVELRIESREGEIRGRVLDEDGAPVDDAFIQVSRLSESAVASAGQSRTMARGPGPAILSDVDGRFTVGELAPGDYVVRAQRRGGGEAIADRVALGSAIELTIVPTGSLAGTIVAPGDSLPERFLVTATDSAQALRVSDSFFRTEGRWQLSGLPVGSYEVVVDSGAGTATLALELAAGERHDDLELVLQPRVTVRGRLIDIDTGEGIAGMDVEIRPRKGGYSRPKSNKADRKQVSDGEGRFEVALAPTGAIRLATRRQSRTESNQYVLSTIYLTIPSSPAIQDIGDIALVRARLGPDEPAGELGFVIETIEPGEPEDAVIEVGRILPGGPASSTTLAVGDVIERVDGKSVSGLDSWRFQALTRVPAGTLLELGLAEGREVTIRVGPPAR
ncbi:carboxypeptidase regulatory-like domain-containing protein [Nannocystaceae bacterium ST9]